MKSKRTIKIIFMALIFMIFSHSVLAEEIQEGNSEEENFYPRAEVIEVVDVIEEEGGYYDSTIQVLKVLIKNGEYEGLEVEAQYELNFYLNQHFKSQQLKVGDEVLVYLEMDETGGIATTYVAEIVRDKYLLYLVIAFVILLLLIGKTKGLKAIISLGITILAIFKILIPFILKG
ncbi:MAG: YibE/F family protein, partial [Eubacteriales bacterium]